MLYSLSAIMLGRLRMSVHDCLAEYKRLGGQVFGSPNFWTELRFGVFHLSTAPKYNAKHLKAAVQEVCKEYKEKEDDTSNGDRLLFPCRKDICKT